MMKICSFIYRFSSYSGVPSPLKDILRGLELVNGVPDPLGDL